MGLGGAANQVPYVGHFSKVGTDVRMMNIVPCGTVETKFGQEKFHPNVGHTGMQIQIQQDKGYHGGVVQWCIMLGLFKAQKQQRTKGQNRFDRPHGKSSKACGIVERVVLHVKRIKVSGMQQAVLPIRPCVNDNNTQHHLHGYQVPCRAHVLQFPNQSNGQSDASHGDGPSRQTRHNKCALCGGVEFLFNGRNFLARSLNSLVNI
mmetsp:Transcript_20730/g.49116  ORF Transcript_20730/g.49116 Transcript_20730/m.49116 type:complete len:205 (-) Transcript_20730:228-842(-)